MGVVLVLLGLTVQAGAAQVSISQEVTAVDGTTDAVSAVSVETTWADTGTDSSYYVGGNVTFLADGADATVWFDYRIEGSDSWQSTPRKTLGSADAFSEYLTGLAAGETYEYRARAKADNDTASGTVETFTVADEPPAAATTEPDRVTEDSARLTGYVEWLAGADSAEVFFVVSPADSDETTRTPGQTITEIGPVNETYGQLAPNTTYEYELHARASDGDNATGSPVQFTTDTEFAVATESARALNETAVTVTGEVADLGGADSATLVVEYRRNGSTEWVRAGETRLDAAGTATETITGLEADTEYEARVSGFAVDNDKAVGETVAVSTDADAGPEAATTGATDVTQHAATLTATVTGLGGADSAEVDFQLRRVGADDWWTFETRTVSAPADVNATFLDFQANATYEYRVVVAASDGDTATASPMRFTTEDAFTARTDAASAVNSTAIVVNGTVTEFGGAKTADVSVQYREAGSLSWTTTTTTGVSSTGTFEGHVTGLEAETEYDVRIYAVAGDGDDYYGEHGTVVTDADPAPVLATTGATDVTDSSATLTGDLADLGGADGARVSFEYRAEGASEWQSTAAAAVNATGSFDATVTGLDGSTTYEYRAVVETSDGDRATGAVRTLTTESAALAPEVDAFSISQKGSPNPHMQFTADWSVSDADGDLTRVTVEVVDSDGTVVERAVSQIGGGSAGGADRFELKHVRDQRFTVRLTVTDESGRTTTDTRTVSE